MNNGKKMNKIKKKSVLLLISVLLLLSGVVTGTLTYFVVNAGPVINTFELGQVPSKVEEEFDGSVKNNVTIKNSGDVSAYIRAAITVTWVKVEDGSVVQENVYGELPVEGVDYTISWTKDGWVEGADGYYYYLYPVDTNTKTGELFTSCKPILLLGTDKTKNQPEGYQLSVEILSQSIQVEGKDSSGKAPVLLAWGTTAAGGPGGSVTGIFGTTLQISSNPAGIQ